MSERSRSPLPLLIGGASLVLFIRSLPAIFRAAGALLRILFTILTAILKVAVRLAAPVAGFLLLRWLFTPRRPEGHTHAPLRPGDSEAARGYAAIFDVPTPDQQRKPQPADDLKQIEGIGPVISRLLAEHGIQTFTRLSQASPEELTKILAERRLARLANPETWPEQARLAAAGDWEGLRTYQNQRKGGRPA